MQRSTPVTQGLARAAIAAALATLALVAAPAARADSPPVPAFDVVVLGATGGIQDGNLSAFFVRPAGQPQGDREHDDG